MHSDSPVTIRLAILVAALGISPSYAAVAPSGPQTDGPFRKVILDADHEVNGKLADTLKNPMELAVAADGRVFYAERAGVIKMWKPETKSTVVIAEIPVFAGLEDGMLGLTLDPGFMTNGWIYLNHSLPETATDSNGKKSGVIRVSRYTLQGERIDLSSEKKVLDVTTQRDECCHVGGSLAFDSQGNLYVSTGDNTNPFGSDGFAPIDERPGRSAWDAQKSASNPNDLRGGISRIHPEQDGTYTIPKGNLFPPGTSGTRPEVYIKGCRNPFRISIDKRDGYLYWGDVGPDAGGPETLRGPAGFDEVNQARAAGFFGWPYFIANDKPYLDYNFATKTPGTAFDPLHPANNSPNNTGAHYLPPAQPAFVYYPNSPSTKFPVVNGGGGRTAMAGPVYYFDAGLKSEHKLPAQYDHTLFIYEWSRNWIIAVHLTPDNQIGKMERFCEKMTFKRPMDLELGPDGCLYLLETGTAWENNTDSQLVRLEYADGK